MSSNAPAESSRAHSAASTADMTPSLPSIIESEVEERGRLKRRRQSSISPRRASSPSRGHDRNSGSRYREHHRKHHRPSSPSSSISPPTVSQKKTRRRSDAEPDHTLRGRALHRSRSRHRARSLILEDEDTIEDLISSFRKRSQPPSRHPISEDEESAELRRQRSYRNLYKAVRRDSQSADPQDGSKPEFLHTRRDILTADGYAT